MSFSTHIKTVAQPMLTEIMHHPFVVGIANGELPKEALTFYVGQDFNYLNAFIKVYAGAIQKCSDRQTMALFADQIEFILNSEIHPHHVFCRVAGVEYESLQHEHQAPMTYLYNEHMYNAMRTGDLIDIIAAMLPCPWTYTEIGNQLVQAGQNNDTNPYADWIDFYAGGMQHNSDEPSLTDKLFALLDREAASYDDDRLQQVEQRFLKSCELEWHFWDQAYYQKDWQFLD